MQLFCRNISPGRQANRAANRHHTTTSLTILVLTSLMATPGLPPSNRINVRCLAPCAECPHVFNWDPDQPWWKQIGLLTLDKTELRDFAGKNGLQDASWHLLLGETYDPDGSSSFQLDNMALVLVGCNGVLNQYKLYAFRDVYWRSRDARRGCSGAIVNVRHPRKVSEDIIFKDTNGVGLFHNMPLGAWQQLVCRDNSRRDLGSVAVMPAWPPPPFDAGSIGEWQAKRLDTLRSVTVPRARRRLPYVKACPKTERCRVISAADCDRWAGDSYDGRLWDVFKTRTRLTPGGDDDKLRMFETWKTLVASMNELGGSQVAPDNAGIFLDHLESFANIAHTARRQAQAAQPVSQAALTLPQLECDRDEITLPELILPELTEVYNPPHQPHQGGQSVGVNPVHHAQGPVHYQGPPYGQPPSLHTLANQGHNHQAEQGPAPSGHSLQHAMY